MLREVDSRWQLQLLGGATLQRDQFRKDRLERKQAGLLAFLALEGAQTRSRLAGLLWADSTEATARNNLRQALKRIKDYTQDSLILGDSALRLEDIEVDVVLLETQVFNRQYASAAKNNLRLLEGYDFEDCPDFDEWLTLQRERLWQVSLQACVLEAARLEQNQQFSEALFWALESIKRDKVAESSYRTVMRLQYLLGDRGAAIQTFGTLEQTLQNELGVRPSATTLALLEEIRSSQALVPVQQTRVELPLSVLRPQKLVGREAAWQQMENAWAAGQAILLAGEAGIGKSRLLEDFLASKASSSIFSGRPGDATVSYATSARTYQQMLEKYTVILPDWVRLELSRILPSLRADQDVLAPLSNDSDVLRFYQAKSEVCQLALAAGMKHIALDDLQFMDTASFAAFQHVFQNHWGNPTGIRTILAYRPNELGVEANEILEQTITAGLAIKIELQLLSTSETTELLSSLALAKDFSSTDLQTYTNGNPLYLLEALRHTLETGADIKDAPRIKQLIAGRLGSLSPEATRLTQIAAVMNQDFTLDRAAMILEKNPFDLSNAMQQLEQAQVMQQERFVHDLIFETVKTSIGAGLQRYLHRQIAQILEAANLGDVSAIRVAEHYLQGQEDSKAIPFLWKAAIYFTSLLKFIEAGQTYETIAAAQFRLGDAREGCTALMWAAKHYLPLQRTDSMKKLVDTFFLYANTEDMRARAFGLQAHLFAAQGDLPAAEKSAFRGLEHAIVAQDLDVQQDIETSLGSFLYYQNKIKEAAIHFEASLALGKQAYEKNQHLQPIEVRLSKEQLAVSMGNTAAINDQLGMHQKAEQFHRESLLMVQQLELREHVFSALSNLGINLYNQGKLLESQQYFLQAKDILEEFSNKLLGGTGTLATLSSVEVVLGQYQSALGHARQGLKIAEESVPQRIALLQSRVAAVLRRLGQPEQALLILEDFLPKAQEIPIFYNMYLCELAITKKSLNQPTDVIEAELMQLRQKTTSIKDISTIDLVLCSLQAPTDAKETAKNLLKTVKPFNMNSIILTANIKLAQALLSLGQAQKALKLTTATLNSPDEIRSSIPIAEILWTHYQAQTATKDTTALTTLKTVLELIQSQQKTLDLEYQTTFLSKNLTNVAILEEARNQGLTVLP